LKYAFPRVLLIAFIVLSLTRCATWYPKSKQWKPIPIESVETQYPIASRETYLRFKRKHFAGIARLDSLLTFNDIRFPAEMLLRQGTDFHHVDLPPFALPPDSMLSHILPTLQLLQDKIIPLVGPVEIVSGYRSKAYNAVAGGAEHSRHLYFDAVDVVPLTKIPETVLKARLREFWYQEGKRYNLGLGLYDYKRFHVDTWKYRNWGDWPDQSE